MKRMALGLVLFICGFIGISSLVCMSINNRFDYDGITGFRGFLLGTNSGVFFILYCVLCLAGLIISYVEAYSKGKRD